MLGEPLRLESLLGALVILLAIQAAEWAEQGRKQGF